MNRRTAFILLPIFALVLMASECQASSEASVLFEKAKFTMVTKGDLHGAIELFNEIIAKYPGEREYAAKSQLYIGLCYEKQGKQQAQKAYQRVIQEYADQREVAAQARTRLAALERPVSAPEPKGMLVRKVLTDPNFGVEGLGEISPDGRFFSYVDWDTGDLAVYEQATGKKRRLTDKGPWEESTEFALFSRWSPDSKQIVYNWYNEHEFYDMRVIGLDGSKPRILYTCAEEAGYVQPFDWFPDGRQILALFGKKDSTVQFVSVSAADNSRRVIKVLSALVPGESWPKNLSLSPDGRYIVYDFPQKEGSQERDIFILAVDGSREIPLVEHPAHDFPLGWAPDGKRILFASNRTGTLGFWLIRVAEGKPQGAPELVMQNIGDIRPMGFTRKGSFYYGISQERSDIYIAELDPETGEILVPAKKAIKLYEGSNLAPDYSPDGKYLAYISKRAALALFSPRMRPDVGDVLCIRSLETGKDREFFPEGLKNFGYPRWSPDSRSVFVVNRVAHTDSMGIYRIDAQTGGIAPVVISEKGGLRWHECSLDGNAIFLVRWDRTKKLSYIVARDIETGMETEIYRAPFSERFYVFSSPDGRRLSLISWSPKAPSILKVLPADGGEPRELYKWELNDRVPPYHTWSADGRYILFSKLRPEQDDLKEQGMKSDLWRIPADGGNPQKLDLNMSVFFSLSIHPDGRHIAFTSPGYTIKEPEIWVMENFLP